MRGQGFRLWGQGDGVIPATVAEAERLSGVRPTDVGRADRRVARLKGAAGGDGAAATARAPHGKAAQRVAAHLMEAGLSAPLLNVAFCCID